MYLYEKSNRMNALYRISTILIAGACIMFSINSCRKSTPVISASNRLFLMHNYHHHNDEIRTEFDTTDLGQPTVVDTHSYYLNTAFALERMSNIYETLIFDRKILLPQHSSDSLLEYYFDDPGIRITLAFFVHQDSISIGQISEYYFYMPGKLVNIRKVDNWTTYK